MGALCDFSLKNKNGAHIDACPQEQNFYKCRKWLLNSQLFDVFKRGELDYLLMTHLDITKMFNCKLQKRSSCVYDTDCLLMSKNWMAFLHVRHYPSHFTNFPKFVHVYLHNIHKNIIPEYCGKNKAHCQCIHFDRSVSWFRNWGFFLKVQGGRIWTGGDHANLLIFL